VPSGLPARLSPSPEQCWLLARLQEVGGIDAEGLNEGDHLAHVGVLDRPCPDPLDVVLGEATEAHAGHVGAGVGLARALVLDDLKELVRPTRDVPLPFLWVHPDGVTDPTGLLELRLGREPYGLGYRPHLVETGVLCLPLAHHAHVRAGHDPARGILELPAVPTGSVRRVVLVL
jgi:hypothetical protein